MEAVKPSDPKSNDFGGCSEKLVQHRSMIWLELVNLFLGVKLLLLVMSFNQSKVSKSLFAV
jgi:hypothetical protein